MTFKGLRRLAAGATLGCLAASAQAGPILEFGFNGTGTTTTSTGSDAAVLDLMTYTGTAGVNEAADLHSAAGSGVGGDLPGHARFGTDRAFDGLYVNPATSANSAAGVNTTATSLVGLTSWTISGWMKAPETIAGGGRAIVNTTPAGKAFDSFGFDLRVGSNAGGLRVTHGGTKNQAAPNLPYSETEKWIFFAATYDSATRTANFYRGYRNAAEAGSNPAGVTLVDTLTELGNGAAAPGTDPGFFVGGWIRPLDPSRNLPGDVTQSFPGLLDNIRVDGAAVGSSGVLNVSALEGYRAADVAVPEPTTLGSLAVVAAGLLLRRNRKR